MPSPLSPAVLLLVVVAACATTASTRGPNPNDKPGGATDLQPGSGATIEDVKRTQGFEPHAGTGDTAQPAGTGAPPEPKEPAPPRSPP